MLKRGLTFCLLILPKGEDYEFSLGVLILSWLWGVQEKIYIRCLDHSPGAQRRILIMYTPSLLGISNLEWPKEISGDWSPESAGFKHITGLSHTRIWCPLSKVEKLKKSRHSLQAGSKWTHKSWRKKECCLWEQHSTRKNAVGMGWGHWWARPPPVISASGESWQWSKSHWPHHQMSYSFTQGRNDHIERETGRVCYRVKSWEWIPCLLWQWEESGRAADRSFPWIKRDQNHWKDNQHTKDSKLLCYVLILGK